MVSQADGEGLVILPSDLSASHCAGALLFGRDDQAACTILCGSGFVRTERPYFAMTKLSRGK